MTSYRRALTRSVLGVATALVATIGIAAPASATTLSASEESCWLNTDTGELRCYSSNADLEAALASRGIELVDTAAPTQSARIAARDEGFAATSATTMSSAYIYARLYADANYKGAVMYVTGTNSAGCNAGLVSQSNMPSGWNDRVSSFTTGYGCRVRLSEHSNQGGSHYGPYASAASLGTFNDKASSYRVAK